MTDEPFIGERMLTAHAQARGAKIGQALVEAALAAARTAGAETARLHAQTAVQGFYARLGFVAYGPEFVEDGIMHVAMWLPLCNHARGESGRRTRSS